MILLGQQGLLLSNHSINILQTKFVEHLGEPTAQSTGLNPCFGWDFTRSPVSDAERAMLLCGLLSLTRDTDVWACIFELWETPNQKPLRPQWVTPNCLTSFPCLPSALKFHLMQCSRRPPQPTARCSPVRPTFTKWKPAQSSVTGAEANTDGVLGNTQLGLPSVTGLSNRVQQTVLSAFDSRNSRWWTASSSLICCHSHRSLRELSVAEVHPSASIGPGGCLMANSLLWEICELPS